MVRIPPRKSFAQHLRTNRAEPGGVNVVQLSKHRERPYQAGRSKHWVKVKNRKHPAIYRVMDALA